MMYYYVINNYKEVGFFKSDLAMRNGGLIFTGLGEEFTIVGYSTNKIEIRGFVADLGTINGEENFFSAKKFAEDGWAVIKPIEVFDTEELAKLLTATVNAQLAEYIGGVELTDTEDLSVIHNMDDDEMPF